MRIEEDLKLGFKDVLIRPKRSTLKSRSDVELERQFTFNTQAKAGQVYLLLPQTWIPLEHFPWHLHWPLSTF